MHQGALDVASVPCHHAGVRADRRREMSAVVTAFVAHVLFLTLAPQTPLVEKEPPPVIDDDVAADTTIDIDSTGIAEARPPNSLTSPLPGTRVPSESRPSAAPPVEAPSRAPAETPPPAAPAPDEDSESETEEEKPATAPGPATTETAPSSETGETGPVKPGPATPPGDEYGALPPSDSAPGVLGVPGLSGPLWAIPGVVPSAAAPKPAPTTIVAAPAIPSDVASRVLSGTLHSRDKDLGIQVPAAGVVAGTVADAMRNSALTDVKGTFEVKLSADGNVESVRFMGSNDGDVKQWQAIAEAARRSLAGRALQMGPDKQPVTVVIKVESKVQYPAGTQKRVDAKPVCANEVIEQMAAGLDSALHGGAVRGIRDDQGRFIPYDELDDESRLKFCIPIGIKAVIDPANIGAHMTNVVSSSFQVKRSGEQALPADAAMPIDRGAPWMPVAQGKTRPPPPPPKKKWKKKKPRRGSVVPVQINGAQ